MSAGSSGTRTGEEGGGSFPRHVTGDRQTEERNTTWTEMYQKVTHLAKKEPGQSTRGRCVEKESWWWGEKVQETVEGKGKKCKE